MIQDARPQIERNIIEQRPSWLNGFLSWLTTRLKITAYCHVTSLYRLLSVLQWNLCRILINNGGLIRRQQAILIKFMVMQWLRGFPRNTMFTSSHYTST